MWCSRCCLKGLCEISKDCINLPSRSFMRRVHGQRKAYHDIKTFLIPSSQSSLTRKKVCSHMYDLQNQCCSRGDLCVYRQPVVVKLARYSLCYLPLHQPSQSADFLCSDFRFQTISYFSSHFFLLFFLPADFISNYFPPGHCSIMSRLRNKPCWNTLETYLPNDNFLFITASGD